MFAGGRVSDPPHDPMLCFWDQIWPFLARKALPWNSRDCRALGLFWKEQHFYDTVFSCDDLVGYTSLKQPRPPQVISFPSAVAGWAASEPGQTLAVEPGAKPNCCWFKPGRAKSNRGQVSSAKLAVRC